MPTFELTDPKGAVYQIEAPDEKSAVSALTEATGGGGASTPAKAPESRGVMQTIDDYMRAAANGMTFGAADRIAAGMSTLTGVGGQSRNLSSLITGDRGSGYAGNLEREQARTGQFAIDHPIGNIGANIAGGAVVPIGAIGAAAKGASLGAKTVYAALTGAGLGGVQGAFGSKDLTDIPETAREAGKGAALGAVVGGAIPGAAKVVGAGYNAVANAINGRAAGMSRGASQHVVDAMLADKPANVQAEVARLGPNAMLADTGPAMLGKAQGASLNSDEGRSILQGALTARNQGTNQRIAGEVDRALGPAEDPQTVTNAIRAHRSAVDEVNYPAAFRGAPPVDTANVLVHLGPMIQGSVGMERKALENLRGMLMTEGPNGVPRPQTDPQILHKIKGEIDNVIQYDAPGLGIPAAALSRQQGALKHLRGELNATLEGQVPGYANANAQSAALARRGEAVDLGTQFLGSGKTTASPDRFANEFNQLQPGEQIAFAKGSRGNIDRVLGTKANDLQALKSELQGEGGWNTAKIATVHGQDAADSLVNTVDSNAKFRDTYNKVVENSQTAQRTAAANAMKPTPATETALINPNMSLTGLAATGAKKAVSSVADALLRRDPSAAYGEVADILSRQGGSRDAAMQAIIDAVNRRQGNAAIAPAVGDSSALIAAILANGYAQNGPMRRQER